MLMLMLSMAPMAMLPMPPIPQHTAMATMVSPDLLPIPLLLPLRPGPPRVSEERGMLMLMPSMVPMAMA